MKHINTEKLRKNYLIKLRLIPQDHISKGIFFKEKLIHKSTTSGGASIEEQDIFEIAFVQHCENIRKGLYASQNQEKLFPEFCYLFDQYIRMILVDDQNGTTHNWVKTYLVHYFSDYCYAAKIRFLIANEEDVKSCFTDAFLDFLNKVSNRNYKLLSRITLKSFFFSIFYKKCVDLKRKNQAIKNRPNQFWTNEDGVQMQKLSEPAKALVERSMLEIAEDYLSQALAELGGTCKKIISWFNYENWTLQEIGDRLGLTADSVKTTKSRCMAKLRKILQEKMKTNEQ